MRVALTYPPFSTLSGSPPTSLSSLSPYLAERGIDVEICDLNIEFFHYFLDRWENLQDILRDDLERRLTGERKTRLHPDRLKMLLHATLPLVSRIMSTKTSRVLEHNIRDLANVYFLDQIIYEFDHLRADLSEVSSSVEQKISDPVLQDFIGRYRWDHVDIVGFSLLAESQFPYAILFARALRAMYPDLRFVIGGPYVTEVFPNLMQSSAVFDLFDYLVVHEGESAMLSILAHEKDSSPIEHPNVFSLQNANHIPEAFHVEDLQFLPVQDFSGFNLAAYEPWEIILPVYSSKGCTWRKCAFCSINHMLSYREKGVPSFVEGIIQIMQATGISHFQIVDEDIRPARLKQLSEEIIKRSPSPIRWIIQTRFYPQLNRELLTLIREAGCYSIELGLESSAEKILKMVRKGISIDTARRIITDCDAVGMNVILNCMVGFPGEEEADAEQTIVFLDEIRSRHPNLSVMCNTQVVRIYKNSDFGKYPAQYGIDTIIPYELSSVMGWSGTEWVTQFKNKYRDHLLFAQKSSRLFRDLQNPAEYTLAVGDDPWISLPHDWVYLERSETRLTQEEDWDTGAPYLIRMFTETYKIFRLNETMNALVQLIVDGSRRLSRIKRDYIAVYPGAPETEVLKTLNNGLALLNEMGAIAFRKDLNDSFKSLPVATY